ncbi:urea amidolyase associated protein UAAP1 [Humisphaera borealis]|uniref:Urea carboxylase-associated family protein n=1 Tax=Humisphaera borealis TaxID=2807512 RepID=A0A7M2WZL3_9BACT|nr:urea amidolyase associated protein UAAP1 [Humisphaera borealis]QOV90833.1 urea carboxylase-associated family protein [Humisphaera borealis]
MQSQLSDPYKAREHARAQAGTKVRAMPTIPASAATDLPAGVSAGDVVWDETLAGGEYAARILKRGSRLRLTNLDGDGCINLLVFNADRPIERINVADTVKVQWNAYVGKGGLVLSDMGRVLLSIVEDTCGQHDTFCGCSNVRSNAKKYGTGDNFGPFPNARDRFLLALLKYGLGKKDIPANINFFKGVKVETDGALTFNPRSSKPGDYVELRAEMNVLVAIANTPHALDPRPQYTCTAVRLTAWRGEQTPADDPIRNASPENLRAFENVEDYFLM